jgi:ABC-type Mn2+/Zn2+ transport system ATPase subunit
VSYSWGFKVQNQNNAGKAPEIINDSSPVLEKINLNLKKDSFLVVSGSIGSGKTTLLHSIMDETIKLEGDHKIQGKIAYVE